MGKRSYWEDQRKNMISGKEFEEVKNARFMCWVFKSSNGDYVAGLENVSLITCYHTQVQEALRGNVCVFYPMRYKWRMPAISAGNKLKYSTLGFELAALPLLMEDREEPLTWDEVEAFVRMQGYNEEWNNVGGAVDVEGYAVREVKQIEDASEGAANHGKG